MSIWNKDYKAFLAKLRQARQDSGLTQMEAAKKLKKKQSYVSKCESGERRVDVAELKEFSRVYGKSPSYFT
jgi:transcriptional regulator with XRE-family HTH domain